MKIAAIILAAGQSRRMGEPKQLLPFGQHCLLDLAINGVSVVEIEEIVLVLGAHAETIEAKMWLDECLIAHNTDWEKGMITSVKTGLKEVQEWADYAVIAPCDYALVEKTTLRALLLRATTTGAPLVRPSHHGRSGHPIVIAKSLFADIMRIDDSLGLDSVVQAYKPEGELVELEDPTIHFDIDTPDDYQRALKAWNARNEGRKAFLDALVHDPAADDPALAKDSNS